MPKELHPSLRKLQWDYYLLSGRIMRIMEQRVAERFQAAGHGDMSIARLHVLSIILNEQRPITAQVVAERMGLTAVTVGRLVRALEEGGWIVRREDPRDGRAYLVEATSKTLSHLDEFRDISDELMDEAYEGVDVEEIAGWMGHLERIAMALERTQTQAPPPAQQDISTVVRRRTGPLPQQVATPDRQQASGAMRRGR